VSVIVTQWTERRTVFFSVFTGVAEVFVFFCPTIYLFPSQHTPKEQKPKQTTDIRVLAHTDTFLYLFIYKYICIVGQFLTERPWLLVKTLTLILHMGMNHGS
jgi:hypothetical protein